MEVKIGVLHAPREIVFESTQEPTQVEAAVEAALTGDSSLLSLTDERGNRILVPSSKLAYVEIGVQLGRRVGFGVA